MNTILFILVLLLLNGSDLHICAMYHGACTLCRGIAKMLYSNELCPMTCIYREDIAIWMSGYSCLHDFCMLLFPLSLYIMVIDVVICLGRMSIEVPQVA